MSTQTDTIRMALERYNKMKWPQTTDGAPCRDELIAQDALAALSELDAQPPAPTVDEVMDVVKQWGERYYYEGYLSDLRARLTKLLTNP